MKIFKNSILKKKIAELWWCVGEGVCQILFVRKLSQQKSIAGPKRSVVLTQKPKFSNSDSRTKYKYLHTIAEERRVEPSRRCQKNVAQQCASMVQHCARRCELAINWGAAGN